MSSLKAWVARDCCGSIGRVGRDVSWLKDLERSAGMSSEPRIFVSGKAYRVVCLLAGILAGVLDLSA